MEPNSTEDQSTLTLHELISKSEARDMARRISQIFRDAIPTRSFKSHVNTERNERRKST